jgi:putative hydrolase of the HAD superfamily
MNTISPIKSGSLRGTALILDFGSVVTYSVFERHSFTEKRLGLPSGSIQWWGPLDPDNDALWRDMLQDKLTERDYWARFSQDVGRMVGKDWSPADFLSAARSSNLNDEIRPEIAALVKAAKSQGALLAVLSNELELFYGPEALAEIEVLKEFDVIVDATHTNILKPDPRAYRLVLEKLGVAPSRAAFLDDQPRNVAGGKAAGLTSLFFDVRNPQASCDSALEALQELAVSLN